MSSAELNRVQRNLDEIELIFIPGSNHGYRNDLIRTFEQNDMFFKNVILPGIHLLESCKSIKLLNNLEEVKTFEIDPLQVFPRGYSPFNRINHEYVGTGIVPFFIRRVNPIKFTAPYYARKLVSHYLEKFKEKKIITLTTRELDREDINGTRKINYKGWNLFFNSLDKEKYQPIVIRDTSLSFGDKELFEGIPEFPAASIHLHTRIAIYEKAYLNFFKNNGTAVPAFRSSANCAWFNEFDNSNFVTSREWFQMNYGMLENSPLPMTTKNKVFFSGADNFNNISKLFESMIERTKNGNSENLNDFTNRENLKHSILAAIKHTVINMKYDVRPEDADLFKVINDLYEKGSLQWKHPLQISLELEKDILPKGTTKRICEMEKSLKPQFSHIFHQQKELMLPN